MTTTPDKFYATRLCGVCAVERLEDRRLFTLPFGLTDSAFGVAGHTLEPLPQIVITQLDQVIVASNGDIYAGGNDGIVRFTSAGTVDGTFAKSGLLVLPGGNLVAEAVGPQENIYALIQSGNGAFLLRYTTTGAVDPSFGQDGAAQVSADTSFTPTALAVQSDGKLIVAGTESTDSGDGAEMRVFRINADGSADTSFGDGGSLQVSLGAGTSADPTVLDKVTGVSVAASGRILIGGGSLAYSPAVGSAPAVYGSAQFAVAGLTSNGQLDGSYGSGGISRSVFASSTAITAAAYTQSQLSTLLLPTGFAARADGSVVLAASVITNSGGGEAVASFNPSGNLAFNEQVEPDGLTGGTVVGAAAMGDGRAVILAGSTDQFDTGYAMTPIAADGTVGDTALTDDLNPKTTDLGSSDNPASIAVAPSGKLIVGGTPLNMHFYELQQFNQGSASASRPDDFANGTINSLNANFLGNFNVAYYDSAAHDLKFVDRLQNGLWNSPITVDATKGAGEYLSITSGAPGIEIAYYCKKTHSLDVATSTNNGVSFRTRVVDDSGNVGQYPSIIINNNGVQVAYYDDTLHDLRLATENSKGKWKISTIDDSGDVGRDAVSVETPTGKLSVAYVDSTHGEIKWAVQNANGTWQIKVAGKTPGGAEGLSMVYDSLDAPAIAFHDLARNELRISRFTSAANAFSVRTIASGLGQSTGVAVSTDTADPSVYAYSASADSVSVFGQPVQAPADESTVVTNGGQYLSVAFSAVDPGYAALAAYLDTATGDLVIRPLAES